MFKKALIASAMLVSVIGANAAGTATVGVNGTATPPTCDITLASTGIAAYGAYSAAQVRAASLFGQNYQLGDRTIDFSIVCGTATKVGIAFSDNKAGKNLPIDGADSIRFGLVDGTNSIAIGSYQMRLTNINIDTVAGNTLVAPNGSTAWATSHLDGTPSVYVAPGTVTAFTKTAGATVPESFTNLTATLYYSLYLGKTYSDAAVNTINFNGSGVMTLTYI